MCPIPDFNHNNVLPPFIGSSHTLQSQVSPYECSILELCQKFATSKERIEILTGFLLFREKMNAEGITHGYQWLAGSFLENIELSENRPPNNIDVLTFYDGKGKAPKEDIIDINSNILSNFREFTLSSLSKPKYKVDHQSLDISEPPLTIVTLTRFYIQKFTHKRNQVWKGILQVPINTPIEDRVALQYLKKQKATI